MIIENKRHISTPDIFLMDSINLYRGRKRHLRLSKSTGPNMWSFTVRGAITPHVSDRHHRFNDQKGNSKNATIGYV